MNTESSYIEQFALYSRIFQPVSKTLPQTCQKILVFSIWVSEEIYNITNMIADHVCFDIAFVHENDILSL